MKILVIGAGRAASDLIEYLLREGQHNHWQVTVGDIDVAAARRKTEAWPNGEAITFNASEASQRREIIERHDIVVSFLPADMHLRVAQDCLALGKNLVTASYVSPEMRELDKKAAAKGLIFLNEVGLDPGLDHMSAMRTLSAIRAKGGRIQSFISSCGALVAPQSNDNPWGYKFTWRPMNVIVAGQGGAARYIRDGALRFIPYHRLFHEVHSVAVPGEYGQLEAYANRDSLNYRSIYGIEDIPTLMRCTLRVPGFCEAWAALIDLGLTDNSYRIADSAKMTFEAFTRAFLPGNITAAHADTREALAFFLNTTPDSALVDRIASTGLLSQDLVPNQNATPAEVLHDLLAARWVFRDEDTDMNVLVDEFIYELHGQTIKHTSALEVYGLDSQHTAISRTVGLPAAIATKLILQGKIPQRGVLLPIHPEIYEPILAELATLGIAFTETEEIIG